MSHIEKSTAASIKEFNRQPSKLEVKQFIDPATITLIIGLVREIMSMFCPTATPLQTAQGMKNPSKSQARQHLREVHQQTAAKLEEDFPEPRPNRGNRKAWKERKREFYRLQKESIDDTADRVYRADRVTLDATPIADVEKMVIEYRAKVGAQ
tara:strand:+ start:168 stop:626 length:459 start_codon:yes stop_codon:yes gene_type:complete